MMHEKSRYIQCHIQTKDEAYKAPEEHCDWPREIDPEVLQLVFLCVVQGEHVGQLFRIGRPFGFSKAYDRSVGFPEQWDADCRRRPRDT